MTAFETIMVERPEPRIARIVMNRPEARNAQNLQMTYDLNAAFDQAVQDDAGKVIISPAPARIFRQGMICGRAARTTPAQIFRRSEIGAALPSQTPMAVSPANRKSICRSRGAGAIWRSRRSPKFTASALPAA